jgi:uncharacterized repeat protein (TIGR01451 family)
MATTGTPDPNSANNLSNTVNTTVQTQADLSITKAGPATATAGDPAGFNYTLTVTNNGPSDSVGGFTVTDVLPAGLTFRSAGSTGGAVVNGQMVTYTFPLGLPSGGTAIYTVHVTLAVNTTAGSVLQNSATVAAAANGTPDPNPANNTSGTTNTTVTQGTPTFIFFVTPPRGALVNAFLPAFQVGVLDQFGNKMAGTNVTLTLVQIASVGVAGHFTANSVLTKATVIGVATFDRVAITARGRYQIRATAGTLTTTLTPLLNFDVGLVNGRHSP